MPKRSPSTAVTLVTCRSDRRPHLGRACSRRSTSGTDALPPRAAQPALHPQARAAGRHRPRPPPGVYVDEVAPSRGLGPAATEPALVVARPVNDWEAGNQRKKDAAQQLAPLTKALDDIEIRTAALFARTEDLSSRGDATVPRTRPDVDENARHEAPADVLARHMTGSYRVARTSLVVLSFANVLRPDGRPT